MISEIVEFARGHIKLRLDQRTVTVEGEMLIRAPGIPDFVVYSDRPLTWDPPDHGEVISDEERSRIFAELVKAGRHRNLEIEIESQSVGNGK
jgi:hypothetical protein